MQKEVIASLIRMVAVVWGLTTSVFLLFRLLPADPAVALVGIQTDPAVIEEVRRKLDLDQPLVTQYVDFLRRLIRGDLGYSYVSHAPVADLLARRIPLTLRIGGLAALVSAIAAVATSLLLEFSSSPRILPVVRRSTAAATAVPVFVLALLLSWVFGYELRLLPMLFDHSAASYVLPVVSLALLPYIWSVRLLYEEFHRLKATGFVQFYRASGMSEGRIIGRHVLMNALPLLLSVVANVAVAITIGSFFVEQIFAIPGAGQLTVYSILRYDVPVVQGVTIVLGCAIVAILATSNLLEAAITHERRRAE